MIFLSANGDGFLEAIIVILLLIYSPAIISIIIGTILSIKRKKLAKKYFIFAAIYILIGLGYCGLMGL